jgi:hypothetical protein
MANQVVSYSPKVPSSIPAVSNCLLATQMLTEAITANKISTVLSKIALEIDLNSISQCIFIEKRDSSNSSNAFIASLNFDFFNNHLFTCFQGQKKSIKLSNALAIIQDLSEIFAKIQLAKDSLPRIADDFSNALEGSSSSTSDIKVEIDGQVVMAINPLSERVVLSTSRGHSSMPIAMIKDCAHLFHKEFIREICPLLGLEPNLRNLLWGVNNIYLGRCILGLTKQVERSANQRCERELTRIVSLIMMPGSAFCTAPLL